MLRGWIIQSDTVLKVAYIMPKHVYCLSISNTVYKVQLGLFVINNKFTSFHNLHGISLSFGSLLRVYVSERFLNYLWICMYLYILVTFVV
jgi:hypothetical protein